MIRANARADLILIDLFHAPCSMLHLSDRHRTHRD